MRLTLLILLAFTFHISHAQQPTRYLIKAGKLFDSENKKFVTNQYIVIEGNKIVKIVQSPDGYKTNSQLIDLSNSTVIPGLIDSHTHLLMMQKSDAPMEKDLIDHTDGDRLLRGAGIGKSFLDAGITTVKDLGNSGQYLDLALKNAIDKGWVTGPRMFVSGPIISPPNGQFDRLAPMNQSLVDEEYAVVKTVDEARSTVVDHRMKGVDLIKICASNDHGLTLSTEQMRAIVEVAHLHKLKVTAHAPQDDIANAAIKAGVDGIEHGYGLSDSTLQLMAKKGVFLVPTDGTFDGYKGIITFSKSSLTDSDITAFVGSTNARLQSAVKAGVKIVFGSDMYLYGPRPVGTEAKNAFVSYFEAGLPVQDVLQIGTYNGALFLGKEKTLGVIKEGAFADIVAFEGDLEKDFKKLIYDKVQFVMKDGVIYKQK